MITAEAIKNTWQRFTEMSESDALKMGTQMTREQPYVQTYLLAASQDEAFDEDEGQTVFYIGMVLWQIVKQNRQELRKITSKILDQAEKANEEALDTMASDSPADFLSASQALVEKYPEPEVLRFAVQSLMEDDEGNSDHPPIRDENLGLAFLYLKVVLDALIGQIKK
jgi:hypothetical protein